MIASTRHPLSPLLVEEALGNVNGYRTNHLSFKSEGLVFGYGEAMPTIYMPTLLSDEGLLGDVAL